MDWFEEAYHPRWRQRIRVERVVHRERSAFQDILVFDSVDFGRVLVLDGVLQTTERDEFVYHEMMAHVPLLAHGRAREVLIVGGGDGGVLEEVLKHPGVERAVMVELDPRVVEVSRSFLPSIGGGAFDDPRSEIRFEDGAAFVAAGERRFDVIIVDSTDPVGPSEELFHEAFYAACKRCLRPGGVLVNQSGNAWGEERTLWRTVHGLRRHFAAVDFYGSAPPTYFSGLFTHGFASDDPATLALDASELTRRGVPAGLRYYAPAVHVAAFAHPPWLEQVVARPDPPPATFTIGS
jgi:spermidine synthase